MPTYHVIDAIDPIVRDLAVAAHGLRARGISLDLLLVDGGGHAAVARAAAARVGLELSVVAGPPDGPGRAYAEGFERIDRERRTDLVVTLDANGRHDPTQIPAMIDRLIDHDLHVVIGSRWTPGSGTPGLSLRRWLLGRGANLAFRLATSARGITDGTTSFRVARADIIRSLRLGDGRTDTYSVHTRFVANAIALGYRVGEAPIIYRPAIAGTGGLAAADAGTFVAHLLDLRREVRRTRRRRLAPTGREFPIEHFGAADDLECLAASKNFFDWVLDGFGPYLHGRVLEVGAGSGTITRRLIERDPTLSVVCLEPAENMFLGLDAYAAHEPRVIANRTTLKEYLSRDAEPFDAVVYVNVLEHIEDDAGELRLAAQALRPGGTVLVFGPAHEALYSELDHKAGHYRRYSTARLRRLAEDAGLEAVTLRYFDPLGALPYLAAYRWARRPAISGSTVWAYDRLIVPLGRLVERALPQPPVGKNILFVGLKR
jgi:2-polyprenyl-3-methyl-5-hydroxy-6-metoxy-1,4-benzoquinol methylase